MVHKERCTTGLNFNYFRRQLSIFDNALRPMPLLALSAQRVRRPLRSSLNCLFQTSLNRSLPIRPISLAPVTSCSQETIRPSLSMVALDKIRLQGFRPEGAMSAMATSGICPPKSLGPRMTALPAERIHWSYHSSISAKFSRHLVNTGTTIGCLRPDPCRSVKSRRMFSLTRA